MVVFPTRPQAAAQLRAGVVQLTNVNAIPRKPDDVWTSSLVNPGAFGFAKLAVAAVSRSKDPENP